MTIVVFNCNSTLLDFLFNNFEVNGSLTNEDDTKANAFGKYYETIYEFDNNCVYDQNNLNNITQWYNQFFAEMDEDEQVELINEETYHRIINTGELTAPGHDFITKNILRQLCNEVYQTIIKILNHCLARRFFLEVWKKGQIITIPKRNADHTQVSSYRPITLLPVGKGFGSNYKGKVVKSLKKSHSNLLIWIQREALYYPASHNTDLSYTIRQAHRTTQRNSIFGYKQSF